MKTAIAFLTKDRTELSKRTIEPLLKVSDLDVFWIDGSTTDEGRDLPLREGLPVMEVVQNVRGGPDAAVVYALTFMLAHRNRYTHIGLCENDVLLRPGWYEACCDLFVRDAGGVPVGAVSPRCYNDRILFQCDGYAVMHNLGWGVQIMTRAAAELSLKRMRTSYTTENRRVFSKLAAVDIGKWWAFSMNENWLSADWGNDRILAQNGMVSLALVPSPVEMIGQVPSLRDQGLTITDNPVEALRNPPQYRRFADNMRSLHAGSWSLNEMPFGEFADRANGAFLYFAHQLPSIGGTYSGDWQLRFNQAFGPFAWQARAAGASLIVPVSGPCEFLVTGGNDGGMLTAQDYYSGYVCQTVIPADAKLPTFTNIKLPSGICYREVSLTFEAPGLTLYALRTREPQAYLQEAFDHSVLPPVEHKPSIMDVESDVAD